MISRKTSLAVMTNGGKANYCNKNKNPQIEEEVDLKRRLC